MKIKLNHTLERHLYTSCPYSDIDVMLSPEDVSASGRWGGATCFHRGQHGSLQGKSLTDSAAACGECFFFFFLSRGHLEDILFTK